MTPRSGVIPAQAGISRIVAVSAAFLLAACASTPPPAQAPRPPAATASKCDPAGGQFAVGAALDASLVERVRVRTGAYIARVLRPGQVVTMEFSDQRVNVEIDAGGKVLRVRCG